MKIEPKAVTKCQQIQVTIKAQIKKAKALRKRIENECVKAITGKLNKVIKLGKKIKERTYAAKAQVKAMNNILELAPKKEKLKLIKKQKKLIANISQFKEQKKEVGKKAGEAVVLAFKKVKELRKSIIKYSAKKKILKKEIKQIMYNLARASQK